MGTSNKDPIDTLNELAQLDHDAIQAYDDAIAKVDDLMAREDLESFKADHQRHITDLQRVIQDLGGEVEEVGRDLKGMLIEGMTKLRSVTGTVGALRAMRMNEKLTNRAYDKAMEIELPPIALSLVSQNLEDERRHLTAIEMHIERLREEEEISDDELDEVEPPEVRV